jgi:hypothetical protein
MTDLQFAGRYPCLPIRCFGRLRSLQNKHPLKQFMYFICSGYICYEAVLSSSSLSCDRSIASSKLSFPKSAILSFLLQLPVSSCFRKVIHSCLRLLPRLLVSIIFPSMMWLRRQFIRNMCLIQLAFLRLNVWRMFLSSFTMSNTASLFSGPSNLSSPSFSSTTFQNFPGTSD